MRYAALSDTGKLRNFNEDSYLATDRLFAVADGLGGHQAGEVASQMACEILAASLEKPPKKNIKKSLATAFQKANEAIFERAWNQPGQYGMGTTLTAVFLSQKTLYIGHVGDSRAYLYREGKLTQLTEDHSLVAELVKQGRLTPEEAEKHPQRAIVTRALGAEPTIEADTFSQKIKIGDRVLLCSDGLNVAVTDDKIAAILASESDLKKACQKLIKAANDKGGPDNITVVLMEVEKPAEAQKEASATKTHWGLFALSVTLAIATVILLLMGVAGYYINKTYWVGFYKNRVTIYRGLPIKIAGISFTQVERKTGIRQSELPYYYQERISQGIVAGDRKKALAVVEDIRSLKSP